ncbi:hypothetical protein GJV85_09455 [Sulfurimonas aquatica]|uniref:Alginate export domain-containing protein n=1 Tax=Sulfurimonas aquatica TaxID=2672570 RepID=A0A975GDG0_9BACT|nr:hypothetical protein [Sulfurimonas aquatica]QSZ42323.1 hypothetical protein GJV85_09455 [Sulfurimonas aquatica]
MKKIIISTVALSAIIGSFSTISANEGLNIFSDTKFSGEIRPRYEFADKEGGTEAANAFTARTRLRVQSKLLDMDGLSATVAVSTVNNFGSTDYSPASPKYDLILDPQKAMLSEAMINYKIGATTIAAGRSHLNLDDQRFIGTVGWRQLERSYDTINVISKPVDGLTLIGAYVYGYEGVDANPTTETNSAVLNAKYIVNDNLTVTGFGYLLADIHDTYGLRATGKVNVDNIKLDYAASYAMQSKASLNATDTVNVDIDASYIDLALGANMSGLLLGVEYESLGQANGSSAKGFTTPLATLHKFQGFADEFLGQTRDSNTAGIIDISLKAGYTAKGFGKALVFYHNFSSDDGSLDLGSEIDALYVNALPGVKGVSALLKAAYYTAGEATSGHTANNTKFWAQLDYKF